MGLSETFYATNDRDLIDFKNIFTGKYRNTTLVKLQISSKDSADNSMSAKQSYYDKFLEENRSARTKYATNFAQILYILLRARFQVLSADTQTIGLCSFPKELLIQIFALSAPIYKSDPTSVITHMGFFQLKVEADELAKVQGTNLMVMGRR